METTSDFLRRIGRAVCALSLVLLTTPANIAFAVGPQQKPQHEIRLLGKSWTPAAGVSQETERALAAQAKAAREKGQVRIHALVQLHDVPDESRRNELSRDGLELGAYATGNAWITAIPVDRATAAARRPEVRSIQPWTADRKLHPRLAEGRIASWARDPEQPGWIAVMVLLHADVDLGRGPALAERAGGSAGKPVQGLHGMAMRVPAANLAALAAEEEVLWIEQVPPPLSATNDGVRDQMKANIVSGSPYDLDGEGVRLLIFEEGVVSTTHESFDPGTGSRVTWTNNALTSRHATAVAGTAAGDGSGSPGLRGRGVAPAAEILSAGFDWVFDPPFWEETGTLEEDYATARNVHEADLANNSVGFNIAQYADSEYADCEMEGDYATGSALIDGIVRGDNPAIDGPMITVWAGGNERRPHAPCGGNYLTTPEPACAKNPIQVGAINSDGGSMTNFSSWGPCDDGRLKPMVVAPGCASGRVDNESGVYTANCGDSPWDEAENCDDDHLYLADASCGSSFAAPAVSGTIALLLQDWRRHLDGPSAEDARLLPALVKAALIHTSRDLGPEGPDYRYGFGAVDAQALIDFERAAGLDALGGPGLKVWGTEQVSQSQADSYILTVPTGIGELKASLAWDDFAAAPFTDGALVNDLDLELLAPNGTVYRPFVLDPANPHHSATTGVNVLDNQEQVLVKNPQPGMWIVRVLGTNVPEGPQSYGLVYSAAPALSSSCSETFTSFETVLDSWSMTGGAARVAAPAPGHGAWSARLGGTNSNESVVKRQIALPIRQRSTWSFDLYMTSEHFPWSTGFDKFSAEVRDLNGAVLSVVSFHNDGDVRDAWLPERNIDLSPWHGQTVQLVFRAETDSMSPTTFWVDDVRVTSCPAASSVYSPPPFESSGAQDGHVFESSENSSVGGTAVANNSSLLGPATFQVGDNPSDAQIKGFVSFDTSSLPDNAILVSARLVLNRSSHLGTNPFATHGVCRVEIRTGSFDNNLSLVPADFQAAATGQPVSILSNPTVNGSFAYATLSSQGLAAINRTGTTQIRISFEQGDDDDMAGDALFFIAGEGTTASLRPRLEVKYLLP